VKFYEFVDKQPPVGRLVVIEGTERVLADRALEILTERLLAPEVRELNLQRFGAEETGDFTRVREAVAAMPFLADRRLTIVTEAQSLKAPARRDLLAAAQAVPEGNTLVITDLVSPRSQRPQALGALAGRGALRVDTTATDDVRGRFVEELLTVLGVRAEAPAVDALVRSTADLAAIRNDLEKLALGSKKITVADLEREALSVEDPKSYHYAGALVEGRIGEALAIAHEFFTSDPRAAMPLLSALASECGSVWELAKPGGALAARFRWRENRLRPLARRIGRRRAQRAFERALGGVEAVVTGRVGSEPDEFRALVDRISVEVSALLAR
jgi:DNA polymerase III delta subunit